jgi:hypothetical protein
VSAMEQHKWTIEYENDPNDTLTGAAAFRCSCTLVMSGPREEVLRLMYDHLPKDWWPAWINGDEYDRHSGQVS